MQQLLKQEQARLKLGEDTWLIWQEGRFRVRIVDPSGDPVAPGYVAANPDVAKPHTDKLGWCEFEALPDGPGGGTNPRITLDDGSVLWGYQCWWEPVYTAAGEAGMTNLETQSEMVWGELLALAPERE